MAKRKYTKKSKYWDKFNVASTPENISPLLQENPYEPSLDGEPYYVSDAACTSRNQIGSNSSSRFNTRHRAARQSKYTNIENGLLPYDYSAGGVEVRDAVELCQKAYANVAVFRNAIDIMSEFANSEIYLEGGSAKSKTFIKKWFQKIKLWGVKDQFFREYYRSGNVFFYKIDGKFDAEDFKKLKESFASLKPGEIPIRYILLNPYDIMIERSTSYKQSLYKKILSEYELERLRDPKNDYDKQVFNNLPKELKESIKNGSWSPDGVQIPLDSEKLRYSFYKKQDYEPFAVPFGFPVLDDINFKIELKKIDQAICRTIENVILLITMGTSPDKGGVNPNNLQAMQSLFENEAVGRALIADYTTKAEFVIPDINKVIGPDKYKIVNEDIKEGLQNIILGDERYSNTQVKANIFLERLKESRNAFINDFLQPEIKQVCEAMGFRDYPIARFQEVDIKDEVQFHRVVTRLMELGILPPEAGIEAIKTGIYPDPKDLEGAQEKFVENREKGYYNPLVGGVPLYDPDADEETEAKPPQQIKAPQPRGRPTKINEKIAAKDVFSRKDIQNTVYAVESFKKKCESLSRKIFKRKRLSQDHKKLIANLVESIVIAKNQPEWESSAEKCLKNLDEIEKLGVLKSVSNVSQKYELEVYPAALLYHSSVKKEKK